MASLILLPARAGPGATISVRGDGFDAGAALSATFGSIPVTLSATTVEGDGTFAATLLVPHLPVGPGDVYVVTVIDSDGATASATFEMCRDGAGDGIDSTVDPVLASGGEVPDIGPTDIVAYAHHAGAHYIAWIDPSVADDSVVTTYPPALNHTLNVTMTPDDGGAVVTYELDTDYCWAFENSDLFLCECSYGGGLVDPVWRNRFWFDERWSKPVYQVRFASDGETLWLAILTRETVAYPYLSTLDNVHCGAGPSACNSDNQASQFAPLSELTSGFSTFPRGVEGAFTKTFHNATGILDFYVDVEHATSDGGENGSGHWAPPRVVMFVGGEGGFTRIGTMDAEFCPGQSNSVPNANGPGGLTQVSPRGDFFSGVSLAASEAEPGVCHMVWSEGGDWGTGGESKPIPPGDSGSGGGGWDGGPPNRDYRVGYSTWDASGKTAEYDLFHSHVDRGDFFFSYREESVLFNIGYSWPTQPDMMASGVHAVRNDHGSPVLFIAWPKVVTNPDLLDPDADGRPWLDRALILSQPVVEMYDIAGGAATLLQTLGGDLVPTAEETAYFWGDSTTPTALAGGIEGYAQDQTATGLQPFTTLDRAIAVSRIYEDPLLDGQPVYLLAVPWSATASPAGGIVNSMRCFYRVPVDGGAAVDFLDGTRQLLFTVMDEHEAVGAGPGLVWTSQDFYSDPHNIWMPHAASVETPAVGLQFDRVCRNEWTLYGEVPAAFVQQDAAGWGSDYDTEADTISVAASANDLPVTLFDYVVYKLCRECVPCRCAPIGMHVWQKV